VLFEGFLRGLFILDRYGKLAKMHFRLNLAIVFAAAIVVAQAPIVQAADTPAVALVRSMNIARQENGLPKLKSSFTLNSAATRHAQDMLKRQYFAHTDPAGRRFTVWINGPAKFGATAENIARHQKTPALASAAWMKSTGHRANILSKQYTHVGTAVIKGTLLGKNTTVYIANFGRPL
jgi:uncharacterized protein YkwD